jgi:hypothetical protein
MEIARSAARDAAATGPGFHPQLVSRMIVASLPIRAAALRRIQTLPTLLILCLHGSAGKVLPVRIPPSHVLAEVRICDWCG